jgi:hypothetical protein
MAGRPKRTALIAELTRRTLECFEVPADAVPDAITGRVSEWTILDYVVRWLESGKTVSGLAAEIGEVLHFDVWPGQIDGVLSDLFGEQESEQAKRSARARGAHSLAEDAILLVDAEQVDQVGVSRAGSRARVRQWTAERWNPAEMAQQKGATVSISITGLHLASLQAAPPLATLPSSPSNVMPSEDAQDVVIESLSEVSDA